MADRKFTVLVMTLLCVSRVDARVKTWEEIKDDIGNFFKNIGRCNRIIDRRGRGELTSPDCDLHCSPRRGACVPVKIFWIVEVRQLLTCECTSFVLFTEWPTTESSAYPTTPSPQLSSVTSTDRPTETTTTTAAEDTRLTSPHSTTLDYSLTSPPSLSENSAVDANISQECVSAESCWTFCQSLGQTGGFCDMGYFDPSANAVQVSCLCTTGDPIPTVSPPPTATPTSPSPGRSVTTITFLDVRCSNAIDGYSLQCFNYCNANHYQVGICLFRAQLYNNPVTVPLMCICYNLTLVLPPLGPSPNPPSTWPVTDWVTQPSLEPTCNVDLGGVYPSCTAYCVSNDFQEGECEYDPPGSDADGCSCYNYTTDTPERTTTDTTTATPDTSPAGPDVGTPLYNSSPETTGYPSSPETPGYPGYPSSYETPGYPSYPSSYETPGYRSSYETPGYPSYPSSSETPGYPSYPSSYETPEYPSYPSSYETPGYPSYPSSYETPGYPSYPSSYETPGYPSYPRSSETPGYPSSYETSGYPSYPSSYETSGYPSYPSSYETTGKPRPPVTPPTYIYVPVTPPPTIMKKHHAMCLYYCKKLGYPKGRAGNIIIKIGRNRYRVMCYCSA